LVNQKVTVAMLENLGYQPDVAGNGLAAVEACSSAAYDAVLMDCQMPEMDGYKAATWIRQREGPQRRIPIIALTANVGQGDRERCLAAGMDDYLGKPARLQTLDSTLRKWIPRMGDRPSPADISSGLPAEHPLRMLERQGRNELVVEIIDLFLETTPQWLEQMREARLKGDAKELFSLAHSLKGAAVQLGAWEMADLCHKVQTLGRAGSMPDSSRRDVRAPASSKSTAIRPLTVRASTAVLAARGRASVMLPFTVWKEAASFQSVRPSAASIDPFTVSASSAPSVNSFTEPF